MVVYQLEDAVKQEEEKIRKHPFPTFVGQSPPEEEVRNGKGKKKKKKRPWIVSSIV